MTEVGGRILLGLVVSLAIGGLSYRRRWLTASGVAGAVALGTLVFGLGGWVWAGTLVAFFASSSLLSYYASARKATVAEEFAKTGRRDLGQVLANGGMAGLLALAVGLLGKQSALYPALALAFYGALGAANADTWATELGVLARRPPQLITTGRTVAAGTSGAVSTEGTLAALAGAAFIGLATFLLIEASALITLGRVLPNEWVIIPVVTLAGVAGALFDSLLGATVQAIYVCPYCQVETERRVHRCGRPTQYAHGWRWLNNDWVNFLASTLGAAVAALFALIIFY